MDSSAIAALIGLFLAILVIVAWWRMFEKAGQVGCLAFIPIVNTILLLQIAGKPWWWILLLLIPFVNIIVLIVVMIGLAEAFGQGPLFAIGLIFLPFIFFLILGLGPAQYLGEKPKYA